MRFLGTGAAEGIPDPFCRCKICENARRVGGKEKRLRSSFRISETVALDVGADFVPQSVFLNEDFYGLEHILYTHTHDDHFNYSVEWVRWVSRVRNPQPVTVWFTDKAYDAVEKFFKTSPFTIGGKESYCSAQNVIFKRLEFGVPAQVGDLTVTPLRGNHMGTFEPNSANYLIRFPDGRQMYYALDSGFYLDETFEALKRYRLDLLISECTSPTEGLPHSCHMNYDSLLETMDILLAQGTITPATKIYLTHFQPDFSTHAQIEAFCVALDKPYTLIPAWDGASLNDDFTIQES